MNWWFYPALGCFIFFGWLCQWPLCDKPLYQRPGIGHFFQLIFMASQNALIITYGMYFDPYRFVVPFVWMMIVPILTGDIGMEIMDHRFPDVRDECEHIEFDERYRHEFPKVRYYIICTFIWIAIATQWYQHGFSWTAAYMSIIVYLEYSLILYNSM